jgi:hypothetical protein
MVNITIDFKNNKIYLKRPYIKGGVYKLSLDSRSDKLAKLIHQEVLKLLTEALQSFRKFNTIYTKSEYIQYDYNPNNQSGFLKLINNGKEIMHLSIFTGNNSTPHLTFNNIEGTKIHIYLADLELNAFNDNKPTTYPDILKKYNGLQDFKSTCRFFYDLLNLIKVKLDYIKDKDPIKQYYTQLKYYIDLFMNIFANPGPSTIYTGKSKGNIDTLTNMTTDVEFTEILNHEINEKIRRIEDFVKRNNGRITGFNSKITDFITIKSQSLTNIITAINNYKTHRNFPITDNKENAFSYTEVFKNEASINAFITEFEEIKKFVESVQLSTELELNSTITSNYNEIVTSIDSINLLFNKGTHDKLSMILDIEEKKLQLTPKQATQLKKFMDICLIKNNDLYKLLDKDNTITNKIQETQALAESKKTEATSAQTKPLTGAKTKPSPTAQTKQTTGAKTSTGGKTKPSTVGRTKPSTFGKTKQTTGGKTKPSTGGKTKPKSPIKRRTNSTTLKKK